MGWVWRQVLSTGIALEPHELWAHALPRLLAAAFGLALVAALLIRLVFRPRRSYLSWRKRGPAHRRRLK